MGVINKSSRGSIHNFWAGVLGETCSCPTCNRIWQHDTEFQQNRPSTSQNGAATQTRYRIAKDVARPKFGEVHSSGKAGCQVCWLIWSGVFMSNPNIHKEAVLRGELLQPRSDFSFVRLITGEGYGSRINDGIDFMLQPWSRFTPTSDDEPATILEPESSEWLNRIESWISVCETHQDCLPDGASVLPSRIIQVDLNDGSMDIRLEEHTNKKAAYIALSHCWGGREPIKTISTNLGDHKQRISWSSLPKSFQNAISIARGIQVQYIWIDALCIVQDDRVDWAAEAANVGTYFRQAWLTVSATSSPDSFHGLYPESVKDHVIPGHSSRKTVFVRKLPSHFELGKVAKPGASNQLPIFERAWTFQERLLSRRILHLGPEEMVWECRSTSWCECMNPIAQKLHHHEELPSSVSRQFQNLNSHQPNHAYQQWCNLLSLYLRRDITHHSDRLPAIEGLAKQFWRQHQRSLGRYCLGIWSNHLPQSLYWKYNGFAKDRSSSVPSWSWASVDCSGSLEFVSDIDSPPEKSFWKDTCKVFTCPPQTWDLSTRSKSGDLDMILVGPVSDAKFGFLTIDARSQTGRWCPVLIDPKAYMDNTDLGHNSSDGKPPFSRSPPEAVVFFPDLESVDGVSPGDTVFCLQIARAAKEGEDYEVRRPHDDEDAWEDCDEEEEDDRGLGSISEGFVEDFSRDQETHKEEARFLILKLSTKDDGSYSRIGVMTCDLVGRPWLVSGKKKAVRIS